MSIFRSTELSVVPIDVAARVWMLLPGRKASVFRKNLAELFIRVLGGDERLAQEIKEIGEFQDTLPTNHPLRAFRDTVRPVAPVVAQDGPDFVKALEMFGAQQRQYFSMLMEQERAAREIEAEKARRAREIEAQEMKRAIEELHRAREIEAEEARRAREIEAEEARRAREIEAEEARRAREVEAETIRTFMEEERLARETLAAETRTAIERVNARHGKPVANGTLRPVEVRVGHASITSFCDMIRNGQIRQPVGCEVVEGNGGNENFGVGNTYRLSMARLYECFQATTTDAMTIRVFGRLIRAYLNIVNVSRNRHGGTPIVMKL